VKELKPDSKEFNDMMSCCSNARYALCRGLFPVPMFEATFTAS